MRRVLHLNVRYSEGGSAQVARTLAETSSEFGFEADFAYGYGPHGKASPKGEEDGALRLTGRAVAAANALSYRLRGIETRFNGPTLHRSLRPLVERADVVHLHVLHSYYVSLTQVIDLLVRLGKPVVWTQHDEWLLTGRCAQPEDCVEWRNGCPTCPTMRAYPPGIIDHAKRESTKKHDQVRRLAASNSLRIVGCAEWLTRRLREKYSHVSTIHNSVDSSFWSELTNSTTSRQLSEGNRVLFMCRDLRDPKKVNWQALQELAHTPRINLTVIGSNAPGPLDGATLLPAISSRKELARVMSQNSELVFFSRVDYHPLTIAEALSAGLSVRALDSRAAREFNLDRVTRFDSMDELLTSYRRAPYPRAASDQQSQAIATYFAPARMTSEYCALYEELLAR